LPDTILSSTALRARQTTEAAVKAAGLAIEPQFTQALYGASSETLLAVVCILPAASACSLLVGHNNGFEDLLGRLTGEWRHMPTAALACIALDLDLWEDVDDNVGTLIWLLTPGQLAHDKQ
jgi:phosphohistidine phosphatase